MKSSLKFVEVTGMFGGKKLLVGKNWITFITPACDENKGDYTIINITDGQRITKLKCKESYEEMAKELIPDYDETIDGKEE